VLVCSTVLHLLEGKGNECGFVPRRSRVGTNAFRGLALWTVERKSLPNVLGEHRAEVPAWWGRKGDDAPSAWLLRRDIT
jgi:hypothetical protein